MINMIQSNKEYSDQTFHALDLTGKQIRAATFLDCTFDKCRFSEAVFESCRLIDCTFKECDLSLVQVPGSTISGGRFTNTKLIGMNWSQADWSGQGIGNPFEFNKCALNHTTFLGVHLGAVKLRRCEAINVDFREASIVGADFAFTDLSDSLFQKTNLSKADLRYAKNYNIDPSQNIIRKARFSLPEAMALLYSMDIELAEE
jgi:uncharacterized protein YjbI with pentapeptide repeats